MFGADCDPIARQTVGTGCGRRHQTCTSASKDVKKCRFWRVMYMFWLGCAGMTLLGRRVFALRALPVADKCLAQFVLLTLVLGVRAAGHTECFANAVHGAMKGKLTCELCRGERNDSISHLGEYGLSFRICALALGLVVKTALIFDAEFSALISNKSVDFERSGFYAMPETLRDFERFVEFDTSDTNAAFACWEREGDGRCGLHGRAEWS